MKKTLFSFLTVVALLLSSMQSYAFIMLPIHIHNGSAGEDCPGNGICYITLGPSTTMMPANMTYDDATMTLTISFTAADLAIYQPDKIATFKGFSSYTFDVDWIAPDDVQKALGATSPIIISKGIPNPLNFDGLNYTIIVKLHS